MHHFRHLPAMPHARRVIYRSFVVALVVIRNTICDQKSNLSSLASSPLYPTDRDIDGLREIPPLIVQRRSRERQRERRNQCDSRFWGENVGDTDVEITSKPKVKNMAHAHSSTAQRCGPGPEMKSWIFFRNISQLFSASRLTSFASESRMKRENVGKIKAYLPSVACKFLF